MDNHLEAYIALTAIARRPSIFLVLACIQDAPSTIIYAAMISLLVGLVVVLKARLGRSRHWWPVVDAGNVGVPTAASTSARECWVFSCFGEYSNTFLRGTHVWILTMHFQTSALVGLHELYLRWTSGHSCAWVISIL